MTVDAFFTLGGFGSGGLFINNGAVVEGPLAVFTVESGGIVEICNGARLDIAALNIEVNGAVVGDEGSLRLASDEFLSNDGRLAMGNSPGEFTIEGNYRQGESGILEIEFAGLTPSDEFDVLNVTGDVEINGKVELKFIDGFAPQQGQQFEFLNVSGSADLSGASFEVHNLSPGFMFDVTPSAGGIMMTALNDGVFVPDTIPGDYNADGTVDAADYVVWSKTGSAPEGYDTWRANFGRIAGSAASLVDTSVPEPRGLILFAISLYAMAALRLPRQR